MMRTTGDGARLTPGSVPSFAVSGLSQNEDEELAALGIEAILKT